MTIGKTLILLANPNNRQTYRQMYIYKIGKMHVYITIKRLKFVLQFDDHKHNFVHAFLSMAISFNDDSLWRFLSMKISFNGDFFQWRFLMAISVFTFFHLKQLFQDIFGLLLAYDKSLFHFFFTLLLLIRIAWSNLSTINLSYIFSLFILFIVKKIRKFFIYSFFFSIKTPRKSRI